MIKHKIGDKVEITGNTVMIDKDGTNRPYFGRITKIVSDGYYIKPLWKKWEGHWYYFEVI